MSRQNRLKAQKGESILMFVNIYCLNIIKLYGNKRIKGDKLNELTDTSVLHLTLNSVFPG